ITSFLRTEFRMLLSRPITSGFILNIQIRPNRSVLSKIHSRAPTVRFHRFSARDRFIRPQSQQLSAANELKILSEFHVVTKRHFLPPFLQRHPRHNPLTSAFVSLISRLQRPTSVDSLAFHHFQKRMLRQRFINRRIVPPFEILRQNRLLNLRRQRIPAYQRNREYYRKPQGTTPEKSHGFHAYR